MQDLSTTAKWVSREPKTGLDHQLVEQLAGALGLHRLVARVLIGRGLTDIRQAKAFLDASLDSEEFPAANIAGLSEVAVALVAAINRDSRIMVFGDFDVDGLSATALLYLALKYLGATVSYLIPSRLEEGYGLTEQVLPRILEKNPQTVITVDCGISASKVVDQLVGSGIEVLISDHHEVSETVPTSALVADPKLDPEGFGQHLAGAGVALALVKLLGQSFDCPELWREYTDLAALGTIADMVPLIGLNRALVRDGLERINHRPRPGIQALTCLQPQNGQLTAVNLSFGMIPRLNAPGRLGRPDEAIQILIADHLEQAIILAGRLEDTNILRRKLEAELAGAAMVQAESNYQAGKKLVVVAGEGWHEGIRGIIASRIARQLGVPAIVFSLIDGQARGSGRSVGSVNLYSALDAVSSLTLQYGGHESAVGVTLDPKNLEEFSNLLEAELAKEPPEHFHPPVIVDAQLSLGDLDWDAVQDLALLEPFGQANPQPSFVSQPVSFYNQRVVGSLGNHVSFEVSDHQTELSAIWFSCPDVAGLLARRGLQEIVFEPQAELWRGQRRLQLRVSDSFAVSIDEALVEAFPELVTGLYPSQVEALDLLGAGHSPLCLMPTGRGKSLVFQIHAARQALIGQAVSLFVYPLRALVNDQQQHLVDRLERIGLNSRILCGLNTPEERASVYQAMSDGEVSMVLTTPEYLLLYADRIAKAARIVFIAFDEAHHIAAENALYRPAYNRLQELHQYFPMTQFLATTATADSQTAFQISQALNLDSLVIDDSRRPNLKLIDRRNDPDRLARTIDIIKNREPCIIYTYSRDAARFLVRDLRKALPDLATEISFYHAGLERDLRQQLEQAFREASCCCLVCTSAFGEGIDITGIRHLVVYHPPFSRSALNQLAGRAGRDGRTAFIHLLVEASDFENNRRLLADSLPEREGLAALYRYLNGLSASLPMIDLPDESLAEGAGRLDPEHLLSAQQVAVGLIVFQELELIELEMVGFRRQIRLTPNQHKVELQASSRYLEAYHEMAEFTTFSEWLLTADSSAIEYLIQGPILPGERIND